MVDGSGAQRFGEFLAARGLSDARAGALLRVTDVTVYHWRSAKKIPSDANRRKIEVFTKTIDPETGELREGIPVNSWDEGRDEEDIGAVEPYDADAASKYRNPGPITKKRARPLRVASPRPTPKKTRKAA